MTRNNTTDPALAAWWAANDRRPTRPLPAVTDFIAEGERRIGNRPTLPPPVTPPSEAITVETPAFVPGAMVLP